MVATVGAGKEMTPPSDHVVGDGPVAGGDADTPLIRFVIVALFDPITVGTTFSRMRWPAHVTLVSNFVTTAFVDEIASAVRRAGILEPPMRIEFEGLDLFGPNRDVPVRLVRVGHVAKLHQQLVDELESLADVAVDEPAYWRAGYRPHLTLGPSIEAAEGECRIARDIAIARLEGDTATIVCSLRTQSR